MAQQPAKLAWKEKTPFGLSASQFGMALGFLGRVSDYVDYQRNIVGTEQEFNGNAATMHGIKTEAKARALYELLTGIQVYDGGFFLSEERMLGCSPDGQSFFYESSDRRKEPPSAPAIGADLTTCSLRETEPAPTLRTEQTRATLSPPRSENLLPEKLQRRRVSADDSGAFSSLIGVKTAVAVSVPFRGTCHRFSAELGNRRSVTEPTLSTHAGADLMEKTEIGKRGVSSRQCSSCLSTTVPGQPIQQSTGASSQLPTPSFPGASPQVPCFPKRRLRLLEIKSPFRALYDCSKELYRPFGIPQQYMCQIQGQMAIAGADECDFFVYLDAPQCQVEAWRVYRSPSFWSWARPKLLQVVQWVRDGLPPGVGRSFAFDSFDFNKLTVVPLIYPFCITSGSPLEDAKRFAFFHRFASPYYSGACRPGEPSDGFVAVKPPGLMDTASVDAVRSEAVKFLFDENDLPEDVEAGARADVCTTWGRSRSLGAEHRDSSSPAREERTGTFRVLGGRDPAFYEDLMYTLIYKGKWGQGLVSDDTADPSLAESICHGVMEGDHSSGIGVRSCAFTKESVHANQLLAAEVDLTTPDDWEPGEVDVVFRFPSAAATAGKGSVKSCRVRLFQRDFFTLLQYSSVAGAETGTVRSSATATPEGGRASSESCDACASAPVTPRRSRAASVASVVYIDVSPPARTRGRQPNDDLSSGVSEPPGTSFVAGNGLTKITVLTPAKRDRSQSLSQQMHRQLFPLRPTQESSNETTCLHASGTNSRRPSPPLTPTPSVQEVNFADLKDLLTDPHGCGKLVLVENLQVPVRTFWRDAVFAQECGNGAVHESLLRVAGDANQITEGSELIMGLGDALDAIARFGDGRTRTDADNAQASWHRSVTSLARRVAGSPDEHKILFCYVEDSARGCLNGCKKWASPRRAATAPCFVLRSQDPAATLRRAVEQALQWGG